jgi:hypothetical protein
MQRYIRSLSMKNGQCKKMYYQYNSN